MNKPIIIGIDGGASKVSTHIIDVDESGKIFKLGEAHSIKEYHNYSDFQNDFKPVKLSNQLEQIKTNKITPTKSERLQSRAYYSAFIDAILDVIIFANTNNIIIGIGLPGVKTIDKRGTAAMVHGPRMPNFASKIEQQLIENNITLAMPIIKLGSDADYCGIGEEFSERGAFKGVENVYYLGAGTGVADALKLNGKLISFSDCHSWIAKTWEMADTENISIENYISARGIQIIYGNYSKIPLSTLTKNNIYLIQILEMAAACDDAAIKTWQVVSTKLAKLIFERITTIYSGWQNNFTLINKNNSVLNINHKFRNSLLDRIVIGQRLAELFRENSAPKYIIEPMLKYLTNLINQSRCLDSQAKLHYLKDGEFNKSLIVASDLRAAPALGAGIDAYQEFMKL